MKKKDLININIVAFFFIFIFVSLFLLVNSNVGKGKNLLIFLPIIYYVLFIVVSRIHSFTNHPGMFVLNVISAIRYFILPILIIVYPDYRDEYGFLVEGIVFMIFEAMCLGLLLILITKRYYKNKSFEPRIEVYEQKNILLKIIITIAIFIIIIKPTILLQYNFVFSNANEIELIKRREVISGLTGLVVDWGKLLLPLVISVPLVKKYKNNNKRWYYYTVITVVLLINVMIFSGTSRNSVIMPATASMFFLMSAFPNKKRDIYILMSAAIVIVTLQLTILKTEYLGTATNVTIENIIDYLGKYFSGPENMGIAIAAKERYSYIFNFKTLLNDLFGNFPGLSHFFELENRTTTFYNLVVYNGGPSRDQIIPSMGQGLFYFGLIFSFIPQMLIVWGMAKFDTLFREASDLSSIYFFSFFAVRFGFTYSQNISIILNFLFSMIVPIVFILAINSIINRKFKIRRTIIYAKN